MLFRLRGLPSYAGEWAGLNSDIHNRFGGALVASPELLQHSFERCDAGELPDWLPVAFQIPSIMDPSLAPAGQHIASAYGFCFPCKAPRLLNTTAKRAATRPHSIPDCPDSLSKVVGHRR